ncbi:hypothetical protein NQ315_004563 [Exocentrus adspersus]|uniref:Methuselah N-terminal domain-containing protein n=1 Tax=Exocentrus adspersus TaxID=1586481 RepID=A0AAV8VMY5_9CUCU|nr:hypothetical protein NQ315_004563 [Exocentrus adspersus]
MDSMTLNKLLVLLVVTIIFVITNSDTEDIVDLCSATTDDLYNYTTTRSESCDCERNDLCIRKCCKPGFYHFHDEDLRSDLYVSVCIRKPNNSAKTFKVPVYDGIRKKYEIRDKFKIGILNCSNTKWQYFKLNKSDPNENVYVQKNGSLYYPHAKKMYNIDRYCVDEEDGLTVYLCYSPAEDTRKVLSRTVVNTGAFPISSSPASVAFVNGRYDDVRGTRVCGERYTVIETLHTSSSRSRELVFNPLTYLVSFDITSFVIHKRTDQQSPGVTTSRTMLDKGCDIGRLGNKINFFAFRDYVPNSISKRKEQRWANLYHQAW